jgi:predicted TPR repeat methyltransferase
MDMIDVTADAGALCDRVARFIATGRPGAARPLLAAARGLGPPSPRLAVLGARLAMGEGAWDDAKSGLDGAIADWPSDAGLRKCRADVRGRTGDREGAVRDAAEAVIIDRHDMAAKAILGVALLDLGRAADAVACLSEAVAAAPSDHQYRQALANALEAGGAPDAALEVLTAGIGLCPASVALRNAAIILCIRRRDFIKAHRLAEDARAAGIADASTFGMNGHALTTLGRHDEAAAAYQDAYKLDPADPYVRHLVVASGALPGAGRAPDGYIRTLFDDCADRFEAHLIGLGYQIPAAMRSALLTHPGVAAGESAGPALDLGCGTGLVALALGDLPIGPFTGIDLSGRMLDQARAKNLYAELRQADIVAYLRDDDRQWPLILAADVLCYFGGLDDVLRAVHARLEPRGRFIFSTEALLPDHDGLVPGDGRWALQRPGRYAHSFDYVYETAIAAGFRVLRIDRPTVRREAGSAVPGLLLTVQRLSA